MPVPQPEPIGKNCLLQDLPYGKNFVMQLGAYLKREEISSSDFAARVGVSPSSVTRWVRGERKPSLEQVVTIERVTNGDVVAADFVSHATSDAAAPPEEAA